MRVRRSGVERWGCERVQLGGASWRGHGNGSRGGARRVVAFWVACRCLPAYFGPPLAVVAGGSELTTGNAGARRVGEWRKAPH